MERPKRKKFTGHPQLDCDLLAKHHANYTRELEKYADFLEERFETARHVWAPAIEELDKPDIGGCLIYSGPSEYGWYDDEFLLIPVEDEDE